MPQVGIYATLPPSPHTHGSPAQGGQLNPEVALNPYPKVEFGDGADGDVVIAGATTLTRDMNYNNLTINAGQYILTAGYKIKVKNKLSIGAGAYISCWGNNGGNAGAGVGGTSGTVLIASRKPYVALPTVGAAGGNGGGAGASVGAAGLAPDVELLNTNLLTMGLLWAGAGGAGGGGVGAAPTAGGIPSRVTTGAKGGNGAIGVHVGANVNYGGGGGGAGGGLIEIWANEIDNAGAIYALGGIGGSGQEDANSQGGGGGGGGGGAILIFYKVASGAGLGVRDVSGGAAGGTLNPGTAGANGFSYAMKIGP